MSTHGSTNRAVWAILLTLTVSAGCSADNGADEGPCAPDVGEFFKIHSARYRSGLTRPGIVSARPCYLNDGTLFVEVDRATNRITTYQPTVSGTQVETWSIESYEAVLKSLARTPDWAGVSAVRPRGYLEGSCGTYKEVARLRLLSVSVGSSPLPTTAYGDGRAVAYIPFEGSLALGASLDSVRSLVRDSCPASVPTAGSVCAVADSCWYSTDGCTYQCTASSWRSACP